MDIENHITILLNKYNLNSLHNKFVAISLLSNTIKESFNWLLLLFSNIVNNYPEYIYNFTIILVIVLIINIPLEKWYNSIKIELIKEIKIANIKYFNERIKNLEKKELLNFDLVEFYNIIEHLNENLEQYIINKRILYTIPFRFISLIIIAITKQFNLLITLFIIFYIVVKILNEHKNNQETILTYKYFEYDQSIRNYVINSKNLLINDEINEQYLLNYINKYQYISKDINELNNTLDFKVNICMLIYILIVIQHKFKNITQFDFYYYFIMIYDIEYVGDKITEYYKNKYILNKMQQRLNYLYKFNPEKKKLNTDNNKITQIIIEPFESTTIKLINPKKIIINENNHILVNGPSGSGKTSLLYLFKGILKISNLNIYPSIESINEQSYLTLSSYKSIYNGYLFDIISNFDQNPNIDLIKYALINSKIDHKFKNNILVNINELSSGEKIRLLICKIIYSIKNSKIKNYNILLFDEIDENLNDELAQEIYKSIDTIFHDKIILYITHNNSVKQLFNKKIIIENGEIKSYL